MTEQGDSYSLPNLLSGVASTWISTDTLADQCHLPEHNAPAIALLLHPECPADSLVAALYFSTARERVGRLQQAYGAFCCAAV